MKNTLIIFSILLAACLASAQSKTEIVDMIRTESNKAGIDPDLALAIATVESGLNPKAVGGLGELGLYQLRPEFHKLTGATQNNIQVGLSYLKWLKEKDKGANGLAWFVKYNTGPYRNLKEPTQTKYYQKVMYQMNNLKKHRRYFVAEN